MSKKKVFALRIDPEILEALQKWADDEFRSINGQIEYLLHEALRKTGRLKDKTPPDLNVENDRNKPWMKNRKASPTTDWLFFEE